ncbi:MAG: carbon-nitrogen hydrolase family protein [Deltaproteobacteria bacterium]|nr:carbon-nitrogen hydrolase family protein [Deltaproteobacteria bacterium]
MAEIALLQMIVSPRKEDNLARAEAAIAAHAGADLIALPELFNTSYQVSDWPAVAEALPEGRTARFLSDMARRHKVYLVGGSVPELVGGRVYNTATLWSPEGSLLLRHRKVHLFDVDIPGGITFKESDFFSPGNEVSVVDTPLGTIGLAICFDVRFPELFRAMALRGAELVLLPAAFNTTTGPAHWDLHLRGRAVENTLFLGACSPAPHPEVSYPAWGHSRWIDPWGIPTGEVEREEGAVRGTFSRDRLRAVRASLPLLSARRPEVYGL